MKGITKSVVIALDDDVFTWQWWGLYERPNVKAVAAVASYLNRSIQYFVNMGKERHEVRAAMTDIMNMNSKFGASDSEPLAQLDRLLDGIYGE